MNAAFLTESQFEGRIPENFPNARTEYAWQIALNSYHYNLFQYNKVKGYDVVFVILPKGVPKLNRVGSEMILNGPDRDISIYSMPIIETLKLNNEKVCVIQEANSSFFEDYDLPTQFSFYNQLAECDVIFAHNKSDIPFYKGLFPGKKVANIPTLMIEHHIKDIVPSRQNKTIIGGNFCAWYGGFRSYMVADTFQNPIYTQTSHCTRPGEDQVPNLNVLPRMMWNDWMRKLSEFKYAVHLMPTAAAGTFSLNAAYFGIPCIGNEKMDTQATCFPELSVDVEDIERAREIAEKIFTDMSEYDRVSKQSMEICRESYHIDGKKWFSHIKTNI